MTLASLLLTSIFAPVIGSIILYASSKVFGKRVGWAALLIPIISTVCLIKAGTMAHWETQQVSVSWIPALGIHFDLILDGVSTFFSLVVSVMGTLVTFYAIQYLHEPIKENTRFYAYLMLFMAAMLGTVLSNNLITMFIFWELTGIASFLLIGFYYTDHQSQRGSRMALLVTGTTGLIMFIGFIMLHLMGNTFVITDLYNLEPGLKALPLAALLVTFGAFGKSAQFPFHFWLPNAMAAPTPVSSYLHSAAMVKLGIFLTARFYPVFSGLESWSTMLIAIGFTTMVVGAVLAVLSNDLKGLLAYTTVSQLGFLMGFYGLGGGHGIEHDFFHIINHVFYKGCLFMVAGIVIHTLHTKDIRKIKGIAKLMPLTTISVIIAAAGMAGIPGTSGFISKELMLTSIFDYIHTNPSLFSSFILVVLRISAISLFMCSARLIFNVFFGKPIDTGSTPHKPSIWFQLPPFILSLGVLFFGLFPGYFGDVLAHLTTAGLHSTHMHHLAIWHGLSIELKTSLTIFVLGTVGYILANKTNWAFASIPKLLQFDLFFDKLLNGINIISKKLTALILTDKPYNYLFIILTFTGIVLATLISPFINNLVIPLVYLKDIGVFELTVSVSIILATFATVIVTSWLSRIIALSVVGLLISFYFILYKAPDLALTQMLIETVSLVLFLLLLSKIPKNFELREKDYIISPLRRLLHALLGIVIGGAMFAFILMTSFPNDLKIGPYFLKNTLPLAEGANSVNTILVDFRGFDTMGEISVLLIATIGVIGLLYPFKRKKKS